MEEQIARFERIGNMVALYGKDLVIALLILVVGLIAAKMLSRLFKRGFEKFALNPAMVATVSNACYIVLLVLAVVIALHFAGVQTVVIGDILLAATLAVVGVIVVFRPLIPTLPFKVGNTIRTGDLLGRVEATTVLNTRIRTFDGKTVFVPNTKILNDYVINYHFTPNRRFEVEVGIGYDQDLVRAKQVLEAILVEDPRVLKKPAPVVYVVNLAESCIELSARGWVENLKYWKTRCELLEKAKLRLDQEGIKIAFPQRDVHLYYESDPSNFHPKNS